MENSHNKILVDCRFWGPAHTGLGRYAQELVRALRRLNPGFKLVFLTPDKTAIKPYSWAEQRHLSGLIKSFKPRLTHFLHFNVPLNFSAPFVVTIHDLIKHHSRGMATTTHWAGSYWLKRLGYYLVMKKAVFASKKIIVPSHWVKQDILDHYHVSKDKIAVIPEAAQDDYFKNSASPNLPYKYFIYVGNAYPHKNVAQLIKAVQIIGREDKKIKLVIVTGRDWFYRCLRRQIAALKAQNVVKLKDFTGDNELRSLYANSLGFVTASYFEGFGLPGLEAMASGTLVLASRRSALPETYGDCAIYFNPDNLDELVAKMRQVLVMPAVSRQKQIAAGRAHASQFSWDATAQKTLEVYQDYFK